MTITDLKKHIISEAKKLYEIEVLKENIDNKSTGKYDIISPDGFSIDREKTWNSPEEAIEAFKVWAKGFERQGYYSSVKYGRIDLRDLEEYCELVEL